MRFRELKAEGLKTSEDAGLLLRELQGWSFRDEILNLDQEADDTFVKAYREALEKLKAHIPLQYITGRAPFYGRDFLVNENVLIPRFDTEILVQEALKEIRGLMAREETDRKEKTCGRDKAGLKEEASVPLKVLDLCTGSGCIAVTLSLEESGLELTASDISEKALETAKKNAESLKAGQNEAGKASKICFVKSDMFENLSGKYDLIISNPPYIREEMIGTLSPEVKDHEPYIALCGGSDGLHFYRIIAREGKRFLSPGGKMLLEIGYDQGEDVKALFSREGYQDIRIVKDLADKERVLSCSTDWKTC